MQYEPIRSYDAPGVLVQQMLEGDASWRAFRDTFLDPDSLSLEEREDIADSLKKGMAGDGLAGAAIDVLTNPFVYLVFVPASAGRALKAGKSIFSVNKELSAGVRKSLGLFAPLKTIQQNMAGTYVPEVASGLFKGYTRRNQHVQQAMNRGDGTQAALLKALQRINPKVRSLQLKAHKAGSEERRLLEGVHAAWMGRAHRLGKSGEGETVAELWTDARRVTYDEQGRVRSSEPLEEMFRDEIEKQVPDGMKNRVGVEYYLREKSKTLQRLREEEFSGKVRQAEEVGDKRRVAELLEERDRVRYVQNPRVVGERPAEPRAPLYEEEAIEEVFRDSRFGRELDDHYWNVQWEALRRHAEMIMDEDVLYGGLGVSKAETEGGVSGRVAKELVGTVQAQADTLLKMDRDKAVNLMWAMRNENMARSAADMVSIQGGAIVQELVGPDMVRFLSEAAQAIGDTEKAGIKAAGDQFMELLEATLVQPVRGRVGYYAPRNNVRLVEVDGVKMHPKDLTRMHKDPALFAAASPVHPLTAQQVTFHPESLRIMDETFGATEESVRHARRVQEAADKAMGHEVVRLRKDGPELEVVSLKRELTGKEKHEPRAVFGLSPDMSEGYANYFADTSRTIALHTDPMTDGELNAIINTVEGGGFQKELLEAYRDPTVPGIVGLENGSDLSWAKDPKRRRRRSRAMVLQMAHDVMPDEHRKQYIRDWVIPVAQGKLDEFESANGAANIYAKQVMGWFARSTLGKGIRGLGETGRKFVDELERLADPDVPLASGRGVTGWAASYLYSTHLGVNVSSMLLNLTQPLLLAGNILPMRDVLPAYLDGVGELFGYMGKRIKRHGLGPISDAQRMDLMEESFQFMGRATGGENVLGIGPDHLGVVDAILAGGRQSSRRQGIDLVVEYAMKGFEKTEWLNRNVVAHALKRTYKRYGGRPSNMLADMERLIQESQFAAGEMNTPGIFLKGWLANPLLRQFLSFPLRSMTGQFLVAPQTGGFGYGEGLARSVFRSLGVGALTYEIGKAVVGVDLSRGLHVAAATDLVLGDGRLVKDESRLPLPPVISIPTDLVQAVAQGDAALMSNTIARLVPGGVALNRALSVAGPVEKEGLLAPLGALQKRYVDWENPDQESGQYPVFDGTGALVTYKSGIQLAAMASGVDPGGWARVGGLDAYLMKQREAMYDMKRKWIDAVARGEHRRAADIKRDYEHRFRDPDTGQKLPLQISAAMMRSVVERKSVTRSERLLERLPGQVRPQFAKMLESDPGRVFGTPTLQEGTIASRPRTMDVREVEEMLRQAEQAEQMERARNVGDAAVQSRPFEGFGGF